MWMDGEYAIISLYMGGNGVAIALAPGSLAVRLDVWLATWYCVQASRGHESCIMSERWKPKRNYGQR